MCTLSYVLWVCYYCYCYYVCVRTCLILCLSEWLVWTDAPFDVVSRLRGLGAPLWPPAALPAFTMSCRPSSIMDIINRSASLTAESADEVGGINKGEPAIEGEPPA